MMFRRIDGPLGEFIGFYLGFCGMRFQTTNTSILKLFWMISMMIFEKLRNGEVIYGGLVSKVEKEANLDNFPNMFRYRYRGVLVHPTRGQHVPVQVQHVPVHANRMQHVPVQVQGVPVHVSPK